MFHSHGLFHERNCDRPTPASSRHIAQIAWSDLDTDIYTQISPREMCMAIVADRTDVRRLTLSQEWLQSLRLVPFVSLESAHGSKCRTPRHLSSCPYATCGSTNNWTLPDPRHLSTFRVACRIKNASRIERASRVLGIF